MRRLGLGVAALVYVWLSAPPAAACGWLWACADRSSTYRVAPRHYGYLNPRRAHRHRDASGYGYAPWSATVRRARQWQLPTALSAGSTNTVGLTAPITSAQGLMYSALPAEGPTLFGPSPPPGYYYGGYYGSSAYGYVSPGGPPIETPSWWVEPRRRR